MVEGGAFENTIIYGIPYQKLVPKMHLKVELMEANLTENIFWGER